MPKRTAENKIKRYKEKIRRLEEKRKPSSELELDIEHGDIQTTENYENEVTNYDCPDLSNELLFPMPDEAPSTPMLSETPLPPTDVDEITKEDVDLSLTPNPTQEPKNTVTETSTEVIIELDPELRLALGDPIEDSPKYGANIHNDLAQRWLPILKKGLAKDVKENLLKEHNVPDNCRLLKSPCLNPEIAAAVTEAVRGRDKKMEVKQNQLGLAITAISRAMDVILNDGKKVETIKLLSEGCRILTDLHYTETQIRTKCITPCLDKSILNIIQEEDRDEFLFGIKLAEKIKAAKAIEKKGWQIKRNVLIPQKVNQLQAKARHTGNWTTPPRYSSSTSRGGRGAYMTSRTQQSRPFRLQAPLPQTGYSQAIQATIPKQRAQTRH